MECMDKFLLKGKSYNQLIDEQNEKSKAIDASITQEAEISDVFQMQEKYGEPYKKLMITSAIDYCMQLAPDFRDKIKKMDYVKALGLVEKMSLYKDGLMVENRHGQKLFIDPIHKQIDEYSPLQVKLKTDERHNDCHIGSWNLMSELGCFDKKRIVTGIIKGASNDANYLHTWIEFEKDGEQKVADYTLNAIMDKDFYYGLRMVDENNLSIIGEDIFFKEKDEVEELFNNGQASIRAYLFYRNELMSEEKQKN